MSGMIISPMIKVLRSARNLPFGENELVQWMLCVSLRNLTDLLQSWGAAEKAAWQGPDQAAIPNRPAAKAA